MLNSDILGYPPKPNPIIGILRAFYFEYLVIMNRPMTKTFEKNDSQYSSRIWQSRAKTHESNFFFDWTPITRKFNRVKWPKCWKKIWTANLRCVNLVFFPWLHSKPSVTRVCNRATYWANIRKKVQFLGHCMVCL